MATTINLLTNKVLMQTVLDALRGATPLTAAVQLHPHQIAYYVQRVSPDVRLRDQTFEDGPFVDLSVQDGWGLVEVEKKVPQTNANRALLDELQFLEGLGFAVRMSDTQKTITEAGSTRDAIYTVYAVSLDAISELYGTAAPTVTTGRGTPVGHEGIFNNVEDEASRREKIRELMQVLVKKVLPGMFWRNYYATYGLASDIHLTHKLGGDMLEMTALWDKLVADFGIQYNTRV